MDKLLSVTEISYRYGWNGAMCTVLLGAPDVIEQVTHTSSPKKLYSVSRVESVVNSEAYKQEKSELGKKIKTHYKVKLQSYVEERMLTKGQIKALGWSDTMITKLLGSPDLIKRVMYKSSNFEAHKYLESRVLSMQDTEEFKVLKELYERRKLSAKKAYGKICKDAITVVCEKEISTLELPSSIEELTALARQSNKPTIPVSLLDKWNVNYLRHRCTTYDNSTRSMPRYGSPAVRNGVELYRYTVYKKLLGVYGGGLDHEIKRQMKDRCRTVHRLYSELGSIDKVAKYLVSKYELKRPKIF